MTSTESKITQLIRCDTLRVEVLKCVHRLNLPECYVGAGFIRNLVWDHLHQKLEATPLNDIDVIYFDKSDTDFKSCLSLESQLKTMMPNVNWELRNQAAMHIRNGDQAYMSTLDAMHYWPEKETAVAVQQTDPGEYQYISAFGLERLFELSITHNPNRQREVFDHRVKSKGWLTQWPNLKVVL
jgi:hypothetical protein